MRRYIDVKAADKDFLMKVFGVSERTVRNALNYVGEYCDNDTARKIRHTALQRGGTVMVTLPEAELQNVQKQEE